jgi:hypothetical protein
VPRGDVRYVDIYVDIYMRFNTAHRERRVDFVHTKDAYKSRSIALQVTNNDAGLHQLSKTPSSVQNGHLEKKTTSRGASDINLMIIDQKLSLEFTIIMTIK